MLNQPFHIESTNIPNGSDGECESFRRLADAEDFLIELDQIARLLFILQTERFDRYDPDHSALAYLSLGLNGALDALRAHLYPPNRNLPRSCSR